MGYIDLICEGVIGQVDHEAAETLGRARKAVHQLITLINDLLDLARIERAEFHLHQEPVDLEELLQETYAHWEKAIDTKGLSYRRVGDHTLPPLLTDKARPWSGVCRGSSRRYPRSDACCSIMNAMLGPILRDVPRSRSSQ